MPAPSLISRPRFIRRCLASVALLPALAGCSIAQHSVDASKKAGGDLSVPSFGEWASEAWRRYNTKTAPPARAVPSLRVFDNRDATRPTAHPAWQLANDLAGDAPLRFGIPAATIFQIVANQNGSLRIGDVSALRALRPAAANDGDFLTSAGSGSTAQALQRWQLSALEARTVTAHGLPALQNRIAARQTNDFDAILAQSLSAQDKARTNIARSLEAALQDDIALARRLDPGALEPYLPSESQALALGNLRLDLLPALDKTDDQTRVADAERIRRDIAIRAALREQELTRRNTLKRLREDLPIQLEATKREELQQTLRSQNQRDQQLRDQAQSEARALIAQDFTADAARLGIALPAQSQAGYALALNAAGANEKSASGNLKRTENQARASFAANPLKISSSSLDALRPALKTNFDRIGTTDAPTSARTRSSEILQILARHDARQWSRISARRDRAWQAKKQVAPSQSAAEGKPKAAKP